ncbi:MAG: ABC transporter substrate-binding protein [Litorimonas sp.]
MKSPAALLLGLYIAAGLTACRAQGSQNSSPAITAPAKPMRIVSLDFCADQYLLKLIEPERILALSPDARKPISYLNDKAQNIPNVRPSAEDVLRLKPDLIIRSYGGGPNAAEFFTQAGLPVINIGWAGDFEAIKSVTQNVANDLGVPQRGQLITADMDARLAAIKPHANMPETLYMTPSGTTTGAGSLVHQIMTKAGLGNFQTQSGWRDIPLERLAYEQPDFIAAGFFDTNIENAWSTMRHPIARKQIATRPAVFLDGSWLSCGAWFAIDAVEALANASNTAPPTPISTP